MKFHKKLLLFIFMIFSNIYLNAQIDHSKVLFTRGEVKVFRGELELVAKKGMSLKSEDLINVMDDSLAIIQYRNNSKVKIDPNSELKLSSTQIKSENFSPEKNESVINLIKGSLLIKFKNKKEEGNLNINYKQVSMGVRGTTFMVGSDSNENGNSYLIVNEGKVEIYSPDENDYELITSGKGILVENGKKLTNPERFSWTKDINWQVDDEKNSTRFTNNKLRNKRKKEIIKKIKKLRERKRKNIPNRIKNRIKKRKKFKAHVKRLRSKRKDVKQRRKVKRVRKERIKARRKLQNWKKKEKQ